MMRTDRAIRAPTPPGRLIRGTATYTVGAILQRGVTFLLLPLFTRILSPAEFGQVGILMTIAAAVSVVVSFGLETAVFRGAGRAVPEASRHSSINTVGAFAIAVPITIAIGFSLVGAGAVSAAASVPADALRLAAIGAALSASATVVPMAILRAQERLGDYLQLTAVQVLVTPVLTVLFVATLGWGVAGWMLAYALGNGVLLIRGLAILDHRWTRSLDLGALSAALAFGLPLVPHALSHWGLSVSDRAILGAFVPSQAVGDYYVAYLVCMPISLVAIAMAQAAQPLFSEMRESAQEVGWMSSVQAVLVIGIAVAVGLLGPPVASVALPAAYSGATSLIPPLALGTALFGLYLMPMNAITLGAGKTNRVWGITLVAALANISLNIALVPRFGTMAAAVNTVIGYGLLLVGVYAFMRRVCDPPLRYDWSRIAWAVLLLAVPAVAAATFMGIDSIGDLAIRVAILSLSVIAVVAGPMRRELTMASRAVGLGTRR